MVSESHRKCVEAGKEYKRKLEEAKEECRREVEASHIKYKEKITERRHKRQRTQ